MGWRGTYVANCFLNHDEEFSTDLGYVDIDDCQTDRDLWERFLLALSQNRKLESIKLTRGIDTHEFINDDDFRRLFRSFSNIPTLTAIKLDGFTMLDLKKTELFFKNNSQIKEIEIESSYYTEVEDIEEEVAGRSLRLHIRLGQRVAF